MPEVPTVARALLWLLPAVALFLLAAVLIAPGPLVGRALVLGTAAVVPGVVVLVLVADARRRRPPDPGSQ